MLPPQQYGYLKTLKTQGKPLKTPRKTLKTQGKPLKTQGTQFLAFLESCYVKKMSQKRPWMLLYTFTPFHTL